METDNGSLSVQVLEFKTSLLDAVQELYIRRDAETRYEEQISKLVLEKQELEWQKEAAQHQINTMTNQHNEALEEVRKGFQGQIRGMKEDKGKHQLTAKLRDKEMNSLKEELKSLQLCRYSLEKKLSELEQKLELQTQSKDGHLKQLGEVEQRFEMVSHQCSTLKQAHHRLQQNVEEAIKLNKKLTAVNKSQESKIKTLTQDKERLNNELVKVRVSSACQSGEESRSFRELQRQVQQLQQRLQTETELNKAFQHENDAAHLGKKEILNSLQHTQQLLHRQTQALRGSHVELLAHREEYQALKRQHELVLEEAEGKEEGFGRLKEEYKKDNILWEREKQALQEQMWAIQEELGSLKEAHEHLHMKHKQLCCARLPAGNIHSLEYELTHSTVVTSVPADGQQPNAHSESVSSEEQIDPGTASQDWTQGNSTTDSEPVPGEITEHVEAQEMAKDNSSSKRKTEFPVGTQPARAGAPPPPHPDAEESRQSCLLDQLELGQAGSHVASVLPKSDQRTAKCGPSDPAVSELASLVMNQDPGLVPGLVCLASCAVDELPGADRCCSVSGMDRWSGGLSAPETSSVYGAENDPRAGGRGEVGVQQTPCSPEARQPQSPDKDPDSQAVTLAQRPVYTESQAQTPAQGPVCTESQAQTPAQGPVYTESQAQTPAQGPVYTESQAQTPAQRLVCTESQAQGPVYTESQAQTPATTATPLSAFTFQKAGERDTVELTGQASQFSGDGPTELAGPTHQKNATDVLQGPDTPSSQSQHPADSSSSQCRDQPQTDLSHRGLQSSDGTSSCLPETQVLQTQGADSSPAAREGVQAVRGVRPEKGIPAVTTDAECRHAAIGPSELFQHPPTVTSPIPPASSALETGPPRGAHPAEECCSSDSLKDLASTPVDTSVTPQTPSAKNTTMGGVERSPSQAAALSITPETKPHRSSFMWGTLAKSSQLMRSCSSGGAQGSPAVTQGRPVCTMSVAAPGPAVSERRSTTPQRFLEVSSAFSSPIFQRDRLNKRDLTANPRMAGGSDGTGIHPGHRRGQREDWNAIRKSLSEMAAGTESRVSIGFSSPERGAATSLSGGNGLQQHCPPSRSLTHPRHQSQPAAEGHTQSLQGRPEWLHTDIPAQIAKVEQVLSSEGESLPKKSKMEEREDEL